MVRFKNPVFNFSQRYLNNHPYLCLEDLIALTINSEFVDEIEG